MTSRPGYTLAYDAEGRLSEVRKNGNLIASFTYDADGTLVKREPARPRCM